MKNNVKHVITKWNPFWNPKEQFEPSTIEVHCEILEKFSGSEQYVWWGKISKSRKLGLDSIHMVSINKQIASGIETHFYMYSPENNSFHVGKLEEVSNDDLKKDSTPQSIILRFLIQYLFGLSLRIFGS